MADKRGIKPDAIGRMGASGSIQAGIPFVYQFATASGATNSVSIIVPFKLRVIDAWVVCTSNNGTAVTFSVLNGTNTICATDGTLNADSDLDLFRVIYMDDAYHDISKGGTLKVTATAAGSDAPTAIVYVSCVRVS
jgi:hypothetical protein